MEISFRTRTDRPFRPSVACLTTTRESQIQSQRSGVARAPAEPCPLRHVQLMSQSQEFKLESRTRARGVTDGQKERPEHQHDCQ
jgi:hypothetical protein